MDRTGFVVLKSVGVGIDPSNGHGYLMLRSDGYDRGSCCAIDDISPEWYAALTVGDAYKLMTLAQDLGEDALNSVKRGINGNYRI